MTKLVVISTSSLDSVEKEKLADLGVDLICRENIGHDFYSWRQGLMSIDIEEFDELLLANDSCYAPLFPFNNVFDRMSSSASDFWGIAISRDINPHVQSYFLCFRKNVLANHAFTQFWARMQPLSDKMEIIHRYEIGLSTLLVKEGFLMDSYFNISTADLLRTLPRNIRANAATITNYNPYKYIKLALMINPSYHHYDLMLKAHSPLIKVALISHIDLDMPTTNLHNVDSINHALVDEIHLHQKRRGKIANIDQWAPKR